MAMAPQALRGFRDFYPEDQFKINYLEDKIAAVCDLFGYQEFEGPAVESVDLYAAKSSEEIVSEQAFVFEDRGADKIALRPELTPTLARMVAAKQNELSFPIRWWSFGRFWRYERPQKGRGREFYQWNCDILGDDTITAEIEIIEIALRFFASLGLTAADCVLELSDRSYVSQLLETQGFTSDQTKNVFKLLDKAPKLDPEAFTQYAQELGFNQEQISFFQSLTSADSVLWRDSQRLTSIMEYFADTEWKEWVSPNLSIVRGFDYYTGIVFEVSDRTKAYRALLGGGRYSNLVAAMGGQPVSGIGFGMGDMALSAYLEDKNLMPEYAPSASSDICLIFLEDEGRTYAAQVATTWRQRGIAVTLTQSPASPSRGLKFASQNKFRYAGIIGSNEQAENTVTIKNLESGEQQTIPPEQVPSLLG